MNSPFISVISPVYGCKTSLFELCTRLKETLAKITDDFEIILVNDGSPDLSWDMIAQLAQKDKRLKAINLSRNFGQHYAITAGLDNCKGEWIVVLDCDLQDQPEEILKLYNKSKEGFDVVLGKRDNRKDSFFKKFSSRCFYLILSYLTDSSHDYSIANFGIYNKKVIDSVLVMNDSIRYFPTMVNWVGFRSVAINVNHTERKLSNSSYSFDQRIKLAMDVILSFSDKPLRLAVKLGLFISATSIFFALYNLFRYILGLVIVPGWTSLIVSMWFLAGIVIFVLGLVGLYVGKIFEKVKNRPMYLVSEKINF